jgi:hypothetical protein
LYCIVYKPLLTFVMIKVMIKRQLAENGTLLKEVP